MGDHESPYPNGSYQMIKIENLRNLPNPNSEDPNEEHTKDSIDTIIRAILDPDNEISLDIDWSFWDNGELYVHFNPNPYDPRQDLPYKIPMRRLIVLQDHVKAGNNVGANIFLTNYTF